MSAITVNLDGKEMILAATAGVLRQVENIKRKASPKHGAGNSNDWQLHIEGCLGEYAVAKALGLFPLGFGKYGHSDLRYNLEVRTGSQDWHSLILHNEDDDNRIFVLVTGINGAYEVIGWIRAEEGKKQEYWSDPAGGRPAYFVPQDALRDMAELSLEDLRSL